MRFKPQFKGAEHNKSSVLTQCLHFIIITVITHVSSSAVRLSGIMVKLQHQAEKVLLMMWDTHTSLL